MNTKEIDNNQPTQIYLTPDEHRFILEQIVKHKDRDALHEWIELNFGVRIPREKICPDHDAPFDFVCDYLFGVFQTAIVLANRSGGKTYTFAILDAILMFLYTMVEIATVAAILPQAERCYGYFSSYIDKQPFQSNVKKKTMRKTEGHNQSLVEILTGTITGVNSPHPQFPFIDEIDLMPWQILQQAFSMAQSKHGVQARTVLTSTRKFPNGSMQRLMNEADKRGAKLYQWCIWEVIEKLPTDDPELMARIRKVFGDELPKNIHLADGYYKWSDAIEKRLSLDDDTWEAEWLCKKPGMEGLVYGNSFSDERNIVTDFDPKEQILGQFYVFEDFGSGPGHPNVVLFAYLAPKASKLTVFDELYIHDGRTQEIWDAVMEKLAVYDLKLERVLWVPDYHGLTEIADREQRGARMLPKVDDAANYLLINGIPMVRNLFEKDLLVITPNCVQLRDEIYSYAYKELPDGTFSKDPVKKNDHGPDALRYGVIQVYPLMMRYLVDKIEGNGDRPDSRSEGGQSITADLYGKVY